MKEKRREFHVFEMLPASEQTGSPIEVEGEPETGVKGSRIEKTHRFVNFVLAETRKEMLSKVEPTGVIYDSLVRVWFYRGLDNWVKLEI